MIDCIVSLSIMSAGLLGYAELGIQHLNLLAEAHHSSISTAHSANRSALLRAIPGLTDEEIHTLLPDPGAKQ